MVDDTPDRIELASLRRLSARIGSDSLLVQGAGGNVSLKVVDFMWIKASGTWLAEADAKDIMVPVTLTPNGLGGFAVADWDETGLRPSIETSMHAALPHRVVLHVHSVDAIAIAVRADAADLLAERLSGLRWTLIPYVRPGVPLMQAIGEATPDGNVDVLVLANHGLVVGADDTAAAEALLGEVVARLACEVRPSPARNPDIDAIAASIGFVAPAEDAVHALALDETHLTIATGGVLYPDHVVFLGPTPLVIGAHEDAAAAFSRARAAGEQPKWVVVRGVGVALAPDVARGAAEMLRCLADVAARIPPDARLAFLGAADIAALMNWDAEKYRQQQNSAA